MKYPILDIKGKEKEMMNLPEEYFGEEINTAVIHQAIVMYQASLRQGTASTKKRSDVAGSGKKPWRQKGTGRARAGSVRSPLWTKGGVVFGPHPRDFGFSLPKKVKRIALQESLNAKLLDKEVVFIDDIKESLKKTKEFVSILESLKINGRILALLDGCDESVYRASGNINLLSLLSAKDVNAYDLLRNKYILITKSALNILLERVKK